MKRIQFVKFIPLLFFVWLLSGSCTRDMDTYKETERQKEVTLKVRVPQARQVTRASSAEEEVSTIDVLVFDSESGNCLYRTAGEKVEAESEWPEEGVKVVRFNMVLYHTENPDRSYDFYVLANSGDAIRALGEVKGKSKEYIGENLISEISPGEKIAATGIPMWGEINGIKDEELGSESLSVDLLRAAAQLEVLVSGDLNNIFAIQEIYLCNYNTRGYVIPSPGNLNPTGNAVFAPTLNDSWRPENDIENEKYITYNSTEGIYTFEAPAGKRGDHAENICLIIKANWLTDRGYRTDRYYRLELAQQKSGFATDYFAINRNHRYSITITAVYSEGYETLEEAYASKGPGGIIAVEVIEENNIIITSGGFFFSLDEVPLVFHANSSEYQSKKLYARTNSMAGWRLEALSTDILGTDRLWTYEQGWLDRDRSWVKSALPTSGQSDRDNVVSQTEIEFEFDFNDTGVDRELFVHFSFEHIIRTAKIIQKAEHGIDYTKSGKGFMELSRFDVRSGPEIRTKLIPYRTIESLIDGGTVYLNGSDRPITLGPKPELTESNSEAIIDYLDRYHIPYRSELMMVWIYDRAWEDDETEIPYEHPVSQYIYEVSNNTTYWANTNCTVSGHGNQISWVNMARGKVNCGTTLSNSNRGEVWNWDENENEGRRLRLVRRNPDGGKYPFIFDASGYAHPEVAKGPMIVSRIQGKGVKHRAILDDKEEFVEDKYEYSLVNSVAAILQVGNRDAEVDQGSGNWQSKGCNAAAGTGWRTPTQRELQLIYALGGMEEEGYKGDYVSFSKLHGMEKELREYNGFTPLATRDLPGGGSYDDFYWSGTKVSVNENRTIRWVVSTSGQTITTLTSDQGSSKAHFRCVRSVTPYMLKEWGVNIEVP